MSYCIQFESGSGSDKILSAGEDIEIETDRSIHDEQEILIPLETADPFSFLFIEEFQRENASFSSQYIHSLQEILLFDFNHNGETLTQEISHVDQEIKKSLPKFLPFLKDLGFSYLIQAHIHQDEISFYLISTEKGLLSSHIHHKLSGILSADRRLIHKISDTIFEEITGKKGIATTRILYAMQVGKEKEEGIDWKSEIWEADYDGANAMQVTDENNYCINPLFFPKEGAFTSGKFLYVNYKLGQSKIYVSTFGNLKGTPLLRLRGNQLLPTISRNGKMIAFISDASGEVDLFVQEFSSDQGPVGKPIQAFSFPKSVQASPTFSPDGKKIAFVSDKEGTPRIYLIDLTSLQKRKMPSPICLTRCYLENTCPAWSPDGTKIAYSAKINGVRQIMLYDIEEKKEIQLTQGEVHKENPSWAHNSFHLVFNTVEPHSSEIFLFNIKQREMVQVTKSGGKKHYPSWEPYRF